MGIINSNYREYKLNNGLVVALQNTPTQTIAAKLRVNYGTSNELDGEEGMAHFLEHCLVTGGSQKYNPLAADKIRECFGSSNAFTNAGRTFFVADFLAEDIEKWLDYVSDHVLTPRFDEERVNAERERVLREIADSKSSPTYLSNIEFNTLLYRSHPKGRFVLRKEEVVRNANYNKIKDFHGRGFHPNNMDLILVGRLPVNIKELIEENFGRFSEGVNTRIKFPELESLIEKSVIQRPAPKILNVENPNESSAQIFFVCSAPIESHPDIYAARTMSEILGGDVNSLLFKSLGLNRGIAYHVGSSYSTGYNTGLLYIEAKVPAKRIDEAIGAIFEEIERMKKQKVDDNVVERVKRKAKYYLASKFESNEGHIVAIEAKLDENLTPEEFIQGFNQVTSDRVIEVANRYLPDKDEGKYILFIRNPLMK